MAKRGDPNARCTAGFSALDYAVDRFPVRASLFSPADTSNIETLYAASSHQTRQKALENAKTFSDNVSKKYAYSGGSEDCLTQSERQSKWDLELQLQNRRIIVDRLSKLSTSAAARN